VKNSVSTRVYTVLYLGVLFSEHLDYEDNACLLAQAGGRALGSVIAKYKSQGFMGYSTFTKLFESCICPILDYSSGVWGFHKFEKINTIQNRAMRIFLGVHRFAPKLALEGDMGWMSSRNCRFICILRLWNRLLNLMTDSQYRYL